MSDRPEPELREEFDFSHAVRGKHYERYAAATNIVVLDPDVAERFPTSKAVNAALRSLEPDTPEASHRR
jgi:hypothetical protein